MRKFLVVLALVPLATACKKKQSEPAPTAAKAAADHAPTPPPNPATGPRAYPRLSLATLTTDEVAPMIPKLKGTALGDPMVQAGGRQVRQSICMGGSDLDAIGSEIQQALVAEGFTASPPRKRGKEDKPRVVVSGQKGEYRVSANVISSLNPACSGKSEVLITFHRVVRRMPGEPMPAEAGGEAATPDAPDALHGTPAEAPAPAPGVKP